MSKSRRKNRLSLYMSFFIAFIMITSVFGVMFYGFAGGGEVIKYEGHKFTATPQGYATKIDGKTYYFDVLPQDLENINIDSSIKSELDSSNALVITSDPKSSYKQDIAVSSYNLNAILTKQGKYTANAFNSANDQLPVITCINATPGLPVMEIIESNQTIATLNNNCITVEFDNTFNLQRATAKILYLILGVIDG